MVRIENGIKKIIFTKRLAAAIAMCVFACAWLGCVGVFADDPDVTVTLENETIDFDVKPFIENERILVPMRAVFEKAGATVTWDADTLTAVVSDGENVADLMVGSNLIIKNDEVVTIETAPTIKDDRLFAPLRALSEAMDYTISWSPKQRIAFVSPLGYTYSEDDYITINEAAYLSVALYEELHDIERSFKRFTQENEKYIEKAVEYGIWPEFDRTSNEYITRDDAAAILGVYVDDTFPVYSNMTGYYDDELGIGREGALKLYNCGITLDRDINEAFTAQKHALRGDFIKLTSMIKDESLRLTELDYDYSELESILTEQMSGYSGTWSLYFKLADKDTALSINNRKAYSASLIKLFVAQAVYTKINNGELDDTEYVEELMSDMITWSSNDAWTTLAATLGGGSYASGMGYVTELAQSSGFSNTGRFLEGNRANYNFTSVNDCGEYLSRLINGEIVNPEYSTRIFELMKQQQVTYKIPAGVPDGVIVANKTGELDYVQGDAAVVFSPGGTYILVVIADDLSDTSDAVRQIAALSETVYGYVNR